MKIPLMILAVLFSYNPCPDEKGTERSLRTDLPSSQIVTILAPMKRGLKDAMGAVLVGQGAVTILAPMKRGLKDSCTLRRWVAQQRYNPCPDEKGTESILNISDRLRCPWLQSLPR